MSNGGRNTDGGRSQVAGAGEGSSYRKVRARRSWDFAVAGVALAIQFSTGRG